MSELFPLHIVLLFTKQTSSSLFCFVFFLPPNNTYHPRFVTEIVDRVQRVNTWQAGVLQPDHHVPVVSVLVHAEGVLSDQHKVRLEGPGAQDVRHVFNCRVSQQWEIRRQRCGIFLPVSRDQLNPLTLWPCARSLWHLCPHCRSPWSWPPGWFQRTPPARVNTTVSPCPASSNSCVITWRSDLHEPPRKGHNRKTGGALSEVRSSCWRATGEIMETRARHEAAR